MHMEAARRSCRWLLQQVSHSILFLLLLTSLLLAKEALLLEALLA